MDQTPFKWIPPGPRSHENKKGRNHQEIQCAPSPSPSPSPPPWTLSRLTLAQIRASRIPHIASLVSSHTPGSHAHHNSAVHCSAASPAPPGSASPALPLRRVSGERFVSVRSFVSFSGGRFDLVAGVRVRALEWELLSATAGWWSRWRGRRFWITFLDFEWRVQELQFW